MKGTVIYPQQTTFQIEIPVEYQGSITSMLGYMWEATNPDSGNPTLDRLNKQGASLRSSMVGDIFIVNDENWMVDGIGWQRLSDFQVILLQQIPHRDRLMGWNWMSTQPSNVLSSKLGKSLATIC